MKSEPCKTCKGSGWADDPDSDGTMVCPGCDGPSPEQLDALFAELVAGLRAGRNLMLG